MRDPRERRTSHFDAFAAALEQKQQAAREAATLDAGTHASAPSSAGDGGAYSGAPGSQEHRAEKTTTRPPGAKSGRTAGQ